MSKSLTKSKSIIIQICYFFPSLYGMLSPLYEIHFCAILLKSIITKITYNIPITRVYFTKMIMYLLMYYYSQIIVYTSNRVLFFMLQNYRGLTKNVCIPTKKYLLTVVTHNNVVYIQLTAVTAADQSIITEDGAVW